MTPSDPVRRSYGFDAKRVLRLTQNLIHIRTSHPEGNELDMVKYIRSLFDGYDVKSSMVQHGGNRASLALTLQGCGGGRKLALIGHVDTIKPTDPTEWQHSPYGADYEDGLIYGIGASNAKGAVAAMINAALHLLENGTVPQRDVMICFTADGDGHGTGAAALYEGGFLHGTEELIFADPTNAEIGIAQKGVLWLEITARGAPRHVLDADKSVRAIDRVMAISDKLRHAMRDMPSHPVLGSSDSFITNMNTGDNFTCILPGRVSATLDIRYSPLIREESIMERLESIARHEEYCHPGLTIEIRKILSRAPIGISGDAPLVQAVGNCFRRLGRKPAKMGLGFYSDSSRIVPRLGAPFVLLGPGDWIFTDRGDEFVSLDSVLFTSRIYADMMMTG